MACFTHPSLVPTFNGLQFRRWQCGPIFICLAVVGSQICEIPQNSEKIWAYSSSRSSKVIDLGVNQKHICDLLLVISHWPYLLSFSIHRRLKLENGWFFPPHPTTSGNAAWADPEWWIDQIRKDNGIPPVDLWRRATSRGHRWAPLWPSLATR